MMSFNEIIRVLLIEDNRGDARLIETMLRESTTPHHLTHADCLADGLAQINSTRIDVILLDLSLPDSQGLNTFNQIHDLAREVPIIVLTGVNDEGLALQAMNQGLQDYLVKDDINSSLLLRAIRYAITRQKLLVELGQQQARAQASEARLRKLIGTNADGIVVIDRQSGVIKFANQAAKELFDRPGDELIGQQFGFPLVTGKSTELDIVRKHGRIPAVVAEMQVVTIDWENKPAFLASLRDVTKRKMMERELLQTSADLAERNADLDQFANMVAHQVRNLLGQILGYASYLQTDSGSTFSAEGQYGLERILKTGHKLNNVLHELLLLSTVRREEMEGVPLDMKRIVSDACKRLEFYIEDTQGRIVIPEEWPTALGRATWIEEVWVNYIGNGLKYGGQPPYLELGATHQNNKMIRFWIRDRGQGISPADQANLFRSDIRLKQLDIKGLGLGLSVSRRIVEKFGGEVGVESEPEKGSLFWFTLPAAEIKDKL